MTTAVIWQFEGSIQEFKDELDLMEYNDFLCLTDDCESKATRVIDGGPYCAKHYTSTLHDPFEKDTVDEDLR